MEIKVKIRPFDVPHGVDEEGVPGNRQDGFFKNKSPTRLLTELEPDVLSQLCDKFRKDVFAAAGKDDPHCQETS
jgi:hypothetical protein